MAVEHPLYIQQNVFLSFSLSLFSTFIYCLSQGWLRFEGGADGKKKDKMMRDIPVTFFLSQSYMFPLLFISLLLL